MTDVSDHLGTFYITQSNDQNKLQQKTYISKHIFSEHDIDMFRLNPSYTDLSSISQMICSNDAYNEFTKVHINPFNFSFPVGEKRPRNKHTEHESWITPGHLIIT